MKKIKRSEIECKLRENEFGEEYEEIVMKDEEEVLASTWGCIETEEELEEVLQENGYELIHDQKVRRELVQGTVEFRISCNILMSLVPPEIAENDDILKEYLADKAFKMIDSAETDVCIDYTRTVHISHKTASELTDEILGDADWKKVIEEDKQK